jgi:tetratricopeptide (TPR) repeat protein
LDESSAVPDDLSAAARPQVAVQPEPAPLPELSLAAQLLRYGDLLRGGGRPERAFEFYDTLLQKQSRAMTKTERSYALLRRGYARFKLVSPLEKEPEKSVKDYDAAVTAAPDAAWAGECLFLAGTLSGTITRDDEAAVGYYTRLITEYADSPYASKGAYYIGINHEVAERWELAYLAFLDAQVKFPGGAAHDLIDDHLRRLRGRVSREFRAQHNPEPTPREENRDR